MTTAPRQSSEAELDALHQVCLRLGGFDDRISMEWLDGALAALAAGPRVPTLDEAVGGLIGEVWSRTFADPQDDSQARQALAARWRVLLSQLDPEALYDDVDWVRLAPLLLVPDAGDADAEAVPAGQEWAEGFMAVVEAPAWGWAAEARNDDEDFEAALALVAALRERGGTSEERLQRIDEACIAVQDLRLWWIEHAPTTAPRRVERVPGRNDPCPCGSGKKYKKCHGLA